MKNPYPEEVSRTGIRDRAEDTTVGGERLATKWYDHNGITVVVVQKQRPYFCIGFDDQQGWLLK